MQYTYCPISHEVKANRQWNLIIYKKTDEWYIKWQRVVQRVTTNDNEWQWMRVTISANFSFFQIRENPTTKHSKEKPLNLEEDLWWRHIELRAETSAQEEILTVRSRNCRSSCSQIFMRISVLKILLYSQENICTRVPF